MQLCCCDMRVPTGWSFRCNNIALGCRSLAAVTYACRQPSQLLPHNQCSLSICDGTATRCHFAAVIFACLLKGCTTAGSIEDIKWRDVRVGHILKVEDEELFPADLLCLFSALEDQACFIKTTNLDGESNLKIRQARFLVQRNMHVLWCNFVAPSLITSVGTGKPHARLTCMGLQHHTDCLGVHYKADLDI